MASATQAGSGAGQSVMRLAAQLHSLSELTETLAFRLLELEERLAAHDLRVQTLLESRATAAADDPGDTELRLEDTEARLARLEGLLLRSVTDREPASIDPFPADDGEQSFMDELETPDYLEEAPDYLDRLSA